jgi:hypothetical protein
MMSSYSPPSREERRKKFRKRNVHDRGEEMRAKEREKEGGMSEREKGGL